MHVCPRHHATRARKSSIGGGQYCLLCDSNFYGWVIQVAHVCNGLEVRDSIVVCASIFGWTQGRFSKLLHDHQVFACHFSQDVLLQWRAHWGTAWNNAFGDLEKPDRNGHIVSWCLAHARLWSWTTKILWTDIGIGITADQHIIPTDRTGFLLKLFIILYIHYDYCIKFPVVQGANKPGLWHVVVVFSAWHTQQGNSPQIPTWVVCYCMAQISLATRWLWVRTSMGETPFRCLVGSNWRCALCGSRWHWPSKHNLEMKHIETWWTECFKMFCPCLALRWGRFVLFGSRVLALVQRWYPRRCPSSFLSHHWALVCGRLLHYRVRWVGRDLCWIESKDSQFCKSIWAWSMVGPFTRFVCSLFCFCSKVHVWNCSFWI